MSGAGVLAKKARLLVTNQLQYLPAHTVHSPAAMTPVVNATVSEAFSDQANYGAAMQRNLLANDADAVEPLHHNVELVHQESADEAGLDLDDAVTRQASGELRRYTLDAAAARSGGAFDTAHASHADMDRVHSHESAGVSHAHDMTNSQRRMALGGSSSRSRVSWSGSFRKSRDINRRAGEQVQDSRKSLATSRKSLDTSRR